MAEYTVPLGTTTIDGSGNYSHVQPGDTLILAPGTRSAMTIENIQGASGNVITIKNGSGRAIINANGSGIGLDIKASEYIRVTGTGTASEFYGIYVYDSDNAGAYIRLVTDEIEFDHIEIGPARVSSAGLRCHTQIANAPPGWEQHNTHIHHCYIHDTGYEAMYIGKDAAPRPSNLIVGIEVNNCIIDSCGFGGTQVRTAEEVSVHDNDIRNSGSLVDPGHSGHALNAGLNVKNAEYYNNMVVNCERGFFGLYLSTGVTVHHNVFVHCGWFDTPKGIQGGVDVDTQGNGLHIYNNTIVESRDYGIKTKATDGTGTLSSNLIAESGGSDIDSSYTLQSNCTYLLVGDVGFVDPDNYDYRLLAESSARGSGHNGVDCGAFPYAGVQNREPAFPSAQGAGAFSLGGRGSTIYKVTTLANGGAGSFREACEASGPRVVVFFVGGYIDLTSEINIENPYLSIYGQTAPGHGITVRGARVRIQTHDVVCRYIRFVPGRDVTNPENVQALIIEYGTDGVGDPSRVPRDIMFDHCTFRWGTDANLRLTNSNWDRFQPENNVGTSHIERVTFQWCFFYECFDDVGGFDHSYNVVIGAGCTNISLHHNLFASCRERNPAIRGGTIEMINNLIFNCIQGTRFGGPTGQDGLEPVYANYTNNWEIHGNDTANNHMCLFSGPDAPACTDPANEKDHLIYPTGNRGFFKSWPFGDEWDVMGCSTGNQEADTRWRTDSPHTIVGGRPVTVHSLNDAYTKILNHAGCKMPLCFGRDKADRRIVRAVKSHGGKIPSSTMEEVGGWPTLSPGYPTPADPDDDGIWSWFETANGSNPAVADADEYDYDGGGAYEQPFMNIEVFANVNDHGDPHVLVDVDVN